MKWYIFNEHTDKPLCWYEDNENKVCEFDSRIDALMFALEMEKLPFDNFYDYYIKEDEITYPNPRNMSGLYPHQNGDSIELRKWR